MIATNPKPNNDLHIKDSLILWYPTHIMDWLVYLVMFIDINDKDIVKWDYAFTYAKVQHW